MGSKATPLRPAPDPDPIELSDEDRAAISHPRSREITDPRELTADEHKLLASALAAHYRLLDGAPNLKGHQRRAFEAHAKLMDKLLDRGAI